LNFTFDGLKAASTSIDRLRNFDLRLKNARLAEGFNQQIETRTAQAIQAFHDGLDDDLNTADALAAIFEYIREVNSAMDSGEFRADNVAGALKLLAEFDAIFDVLTPSQKEGGLSDAEIDSLIADRTKAKKARDFARADAIRNQLVELGVILEDTKDGVRWKRK
jgi:cysteinyl-tRNA synthetase